MMLKSLNAVFLVLVLLAGRGAWAQASGARGLLAVSQEVELSGGGEHCIHCSAFDAANNRVLFFGDVFSNREAHAGGVSPVMWVVDVETQGVKSYTMAANENPPECGSL